MPDVSPNGFIRNVTNSHIPDEAVWRNVGHFLVLTTTNLHIMLGFGLVCRAVKVFLSVSSLFPYWENRPGRNEHDAPGRRNVWDPNSHDCLLVELDRTWAIARELPHACNRSSNRESHRWPTRDSSRITVLQPADVRSPVPCLVQRGDGHVTWDRMSSSGRVVLAFFWSIFEFSLTKENWQERLSQRHSPAQILTY